VVTITDFLQSTFGNNLGKGLQPAGLAPAAILVLLQVVFILPTLLNHNAAVALALLSLGPAWQAVLLSATVLIASYLLAATSNLILKLVSGETWGVSPILGRLLLAREQAKLKALADPGPRAARDAEAASAQLNARMALVTGYPAGRQYLTPTALGNVLNAVAGYTWQRYRIDLRALLPHLQTAMGEDGVLLARLNNEKATLDLLVNLTFVLGLAGAENVLVQSAFGQWAAAWLALPLFLAGYAVYWAAVSQAHTWADLIGMVFDLHREKLRCLLNLRPFLSPADERQVWEQVSDWLLWGDPPGPIFAGDPASALARVAPGTSGQVGPGPQVDAAEAPFQPSGPAGAPVAVIARTATWLVANPGTEPADVHLTVTDPDLLSAPPDGIVDPPGWSHRWEPEPGTSGPPVLHWTSAGVPAKGTRVLSYAAPIARFQLAVDGLRTDGLTVAGRVRRRSGLVAYDCAVEIRNDGEVTAQQVTLAVIVQLGQGSVYPSLARFGIAQADGRPAVHAAAGRRSQDVPLGYQWPAVTLPPGAALTMRFHLLTDQGATGETPRAAEARRQWALCQSRLALDGHLPNPAGDEVSYDRLIGNGRPPDQSWAVMELEDPATRADGSVVALWNNLGCAWLHLREWDAAAHAFAEAERAGRGFPAALATQAKPADPALTAVAENLRVLRLARNEFTTWEGARLAWPGQPGVLGWR
jgi:hypothetical protein